MGNFDVSPKAQKRSGLFEGSCPDLTFGRPELQLEHDSQLSIRGNGTGWLELTSDGICNSERRCMNVIGIVFTLPYLGLLELHP